MPVYATLSNYTGYFDESVLGTVDQIHILGTEETKYKILTDFIDVGLQHLKHRRCAHPCLHLSGGL